MSPLLDYTSTVPVSRTVAQVQAKLVEHGARAVMMEYDDRGRITALAFLTALSGDEANRGRSSSLGPGEGSSPMQMGECVHESELEPIGREELVSED